MEVFSNFIKLFGRDDDLILLLCKARTPWTSETLTAFDSLVKGLRELKPLNEVHSLLDVPYPLLKDGDEISIRPTREWLFPNDLPDFGRFRAFVASMTPEGAFLGNFFKPASETAIILLRLNPEFVDNQGRIKATGEIRNWLKNSEFSRCFVFTLGGMAAVRADGMILVQNDQRRLLPIALIVIMVVLYWIYGRFIDVFLVIAHVLCSLLVTLGVMGYLGIKFSVLSSVMPVILVTTGSCYSIQMLSRIHLRLQLDPPSDFLNNSERFWETTWFAETFAEMLQPIFLANITTVIGFLSLYIADMQLINEFAVICAGGVFSAFVLVMTIFPLFVASFPPPKPGEVKPFGIRYIQRIIIRIVAFDSRYSGKITGVLLVFGLLAIGAAGLVKVKAFIFDDFYKDSPFMQDIRKTEVVCNGVLPLSIVIETKTPRAALRLSCLRKAAEIAKFLRIQPEVGKVNSPSDMISQVWGFMFPTESDIASNQSYLGLPKSDQNLMYVLQLFMANGWIDPGIRLVARNLSAIQISFRMWDIESGLAIPFIDRLKNYLSQYEDKETSVQLTGTAQMIEESYRNVFANLVSSFVVVIAFTIFIFLVFFPHPLTVLVAFLGNFFPMMYVISLMAALEISFKPSTVTIFGIALGLAVDNTIYFLRERKNYILKGFSPQKAARLGLRKAALGIIISSFSLCAGFLTLLFSEFEAQYLIGLLLSVSVTMALFYDLFFVPSAMMHLGKIIRD
ncbi:MAG: MMPL family transporter [Candidatus Riflebacteria bacterium]|nr:MMPL family transporter [Candidatus Riflebacteria bacterium]